MPLLEPCFVILVVLPPDNVGVAVQMRALMPVEIILVELALKPVHVARIASLPLFGLHLLMEVPRILFLAVKLRRLLLGLKERVVIHLSIYGLKHTFYYTSFRSSARFSRIVFCWVTTLYR